MSYTTKVGHQLKTKYKKKRKEIESMDPREQFWLVSWTRMKGVRNVNWTKVVLIYYLCLIIFILRVVNEIFSCAWEGMVTTHMWIRKKSRMRNSCNAALPMLVVNKVLPHPASFYTFYYLLQSVEGSFFRGWKWPYHTYNWFESWVLFFVRRVFSACNCGD